MRKYITNLILIWALATVGLGSCSFLDVDVPDNLLKEDYWKSKDQVEAALTGVYTSIGTNLTQMIEWGDLRSEIYDYGDASGSALVEFVRQDISTTNSLVSWTGIYRAINWTNSFLKNARSTMQHDPTIREEEMSAWESEAYAIRALYYFYLVRTFKDVPLILEVYESDTQIPYAAPAPEETVLDSIESDLKRALEHARESFDNPQETYGYITKNAVKAIWADVKLWKGDYDGCIALCDELGQVYDNRLLNGTEWYTMFSIGNSPESIFEYQFLNNKGSSSPLYNLYYLGSGNILKANYEYMTERINTLFPTVSENHTFGDTIRIAGATVNSTGEVLKYLLTSPYNQPLEYRGADGRDANFIFYRYREILLIKAEALAVKNEYEKAVACINKIRKATGVPEVEESSTYGEGESFFNNLLDERICELAFEGKHWFSQVRMARRGYEDLIIERNATAAQYSVPEEKFQTIRARLLEHESWFLPYYKTEVEKNPLLNQKTYYEGK